VRTWWVPQLVTELLRCVVLPAGSRPQGLQAALVCGAVSTCCPSFSHVLAVCTLDESSASILLHKNAFLDKHVIAIALAFACYRDVHALWCVAFLYHIVAWFAVGASVVANVSTLVTYGSVIARSPASVLSQVSPADNSLVIALYKEKLRAAGVPPDSLTITVADVTAVTVVPDAIFAVQFSLQLPPLSIFEAKEVCFRPIRLLVLVFLVLLCL
jgi:hypothetical protein